MLDRLSRSMADTAQAYDFLKFHGVQIHAANDGVFSDPMLVGLRGMIAEKFLADLSDRVKGRSLERAKEGKFPGKPPFGYRPGKEPGKPVIYEPEAKVVRRIFREYIAGVSPRAIAAGLNRDGIPTPDRKNSAKEWRHQMFLGGQGKRGIISNPIYNGQILWNTQTTVRAPGTKRRIKRAVPESEHIVREAEHLRIVPKELWSAAQNLRLKRGASKRGPDGKVLKRYFVSNCGELLTGLLRCEACGGNMLVSGYTPSTGDRRIQCSSANGGGACDHRKSYNLAKITDGMIDFMGKHLLDPAGFGDYAEELRAQFKASGPRDGRALVAARNELAKREAQTRRLVDAIANSDSPRLVARLDEVEDEARRLAEQIRLLEAKVSDAKLKPKAVAAFCERVEDLVSRLKSGKPSEDERAALHGIFDSIVVHRCDEIGEWAITPYAKAAAMGGVSHADNGGFIFPNPPSSLSRKPLCLGRWRKAA
jgi:hypothetical protein